MTQTQRLQPPGSAGFLALGERRIEYRFFGSPGAIAGDLVMLHEGLGSVSMWREFPAALAAATGCRTLVFSRHGYGRSSPLTAPRDAEFMYEEARVWLPAVLDALGIERPVLLGHSDGASIALIHGALPAARIAGIIALAPHINVEQTAIDNIQRAKAAYETTDLRVRLARYHDDVDSAFWGWNRIWLDPSLRSWNIEGLLPAIRAPILAIQGRGDEYGTLEQVEGIRRLVPSAATLILEDCGHSPHRDQPAAVTHAVTAFVENVAARGDSA